MANTYTNHGFTNLNGSNFDTVLDLDKFQTELCFPFVEYTTGNGSKVRLVATRLNADFFGRVGLEMTETIEKDANEWKGSGKIVKTSTRTLFVDASGAVVGPEVALEDDATREILDSEGNSFDPQRFKKKLVTGHNNEFDFFVKEFFKGSMIISDYVLQVLATTAGVSLPA